MVGFKQTATFVVLHVADGVGRQATEELGLFMIRRWVVIKIGAQPISMFGSSCLLPS